MVQEVDNLPCQAELGSEAWSYIIDAVLAI